MGLLYFDHIKRLLLYLPNQKYDIEKLRNDYLDAENCSVKLLKIETILKEFTLVKVATFSHRGICFLFTKLY